MQAGSHRALIQVVRENSVSMNQLQLWRVRFVLFQAELDLRGH